MNLRTAVITLRVLASLGILGALVSIGATIWHLAAGGPFRERDAQALVLDVFLIALFLVLVGMIGPTTRQGAGAVPPRRVPRGRFVAALAAGSFAGLATATAGYAIALQDGRRAAIAVVLALAAVIAWRMSKPREGTR